tara:strand:- start:5 stop:409 length:405 start_codon:yes stop_codon:yes gene_type:complete
MPRRTRRRGTGRGRGRGRGKTKRIAGGLEDVSGMLGEIIQVAQKEKKKLQKVLKEASRQETPTGARTSTRPLVLKKRIEKNKMQTKKNQQVLRNFISYDKASQGAPQIKVPRATKGNNTFEMNDMLASVDLPRQ